MSIVTYATKAGGFWALAELSLPSRFERRLTSFQVVLSSQSLPSVCWRADLLSGRLESLSSLLLTERRLFCLQWLPVLARC